MQGLAAVQAMSDQTLLIESIQADLRDLELTPVALILWLGALEITV